VLWDSPSALSPEDWAEEAESPVEEPNETGAVGIRGLLSIEILKGWFFGCISGNNLSSSTSGPGMTFSPGVGGDESTSYCGTSWEST